MLDYFGMAQDCRIMIERIYKWQHNQIQIPFYVVLFIDSIKEFEGYCLNQPSYIDELITPKTK